MRIFRVSSPDGLVVGKLTNEDFTCVNPAHTKCAIMSDVSISVVYMKRPEALHQTRTEVNVDCALMMSFIG